MTDYVTRHQAVAAVAGLTRARLAAFIAADVIVPIDTASGPMFRISDLSRLALLCDLTDHFDLTGDAMGVVIGLVDQLHVARQRLFAMAQAMEDEPQDLRARIGARFVGILAV
jgi:chaperone modulatory protein CbpM